MAQSEPVIALEAEDEQIPEQVATTPTEPIKTANSGGCELVNNYNWDKRVAYAVCMAESGGNANAENWNDRHNGCIGSGGLMQIACVHTGGVLELDPVKNMAKAYEIYQRSGWRQWGAFTSNAYMRYM